MRGQSTLISLVCLLMAFMTCHQRACADSPKREFRGAWMHTVFQSQYKKQTTDENKQYIRRQLDLLKNAGINAVFFQVRPQSDAFYHSDYEPWSIFLTEGGKAPNPYWDPLKFITDEAHARGMELHAWLNPYRVTSSAKQTVSQGHIYYKHPERFVKYDGKIYFDPGIPENREYIEKIVADIVSRYDIDGIHFDDYFYPYPVKNIPFPDNKSYAKYGKGKKKDDWRRENVNLLIKNLSAKIKSLKPWVRFGVSPFGIWRNNKNDTRGSATNGLENYSELYADVLLWSEKGWIDYLIPQIYWEREHPRASYDVLVDWWNNNANNRHVYIGQHTEVTMNKPDIDGSKEKSQLKSKIEMTRNAPNIDGSCWWPAYTVTNNYSGVADSLKLVHHSSVAIVPSYSWLSSSLPESPSDLKLNGTSLSWSSTEPSGHISDGVRFVVYRFDNDDSFDLENADNIIAVTSAKNIHVTTPGYYVVTALDRVNNESFPSEAIRVK